MATSGPLARRKTIADAAWQGQAHSMEAPSDSLAADSHWAPYHWRHRSGRAALGIAMLHLLGRTT
eukprot:6459155-Alexandrium_andersonii.AAC.1